MINSAFVQPLRIAFAASELAPYAKTGGLADVAASLPATLQALGHDVRVFVPLHGVIDRRRQALEPMHESAISLSLADETVAFALYRDPTSKLPIVFIDCPQKGIELLFETLPDLLERGLFQLVVLGAGEAKYETFFGRLQQRFADRVYFHRGFQDGLAHWIEAASDLFLMPSRYEPCGLNQMYSLRYGTVPVVRKTGGLADSVSLFDPESGDGTGVVFEHYTPRAVAWALETGAILYSRPDVWRRLMENGMAQDFSWERQAEAYIAIYRRLLIH